jgi:DNA-binding HxlR family transcriptional regulator
VISSLWLGSFASSNVNFQPKIAGLGESVSICHLQNASEKCDHGNVAKKKSSPKWRSGCPLNASVEILGDRWSLLIIRDIMLRGFRTYKEFLDSYEGIATNILAGRLQRLIAHGIIATQPDPSDGRKLFYLLTAKGLDLAPVLTEMVLWAAAHEDTENQALVRQIQKDKEQFLASMRQRWAGKTIPSA